MLFMVFEIISIIDTSIYASIDEKNLKRNSR